MKEDKYILSSNVIDTFTGFVISPEEHDYIQRNYKIDVAIGLVKRWLYEKQKEVLLGSRDAELKREWALSQGYLMKLQKMKNNIFTEDLLQPIEKVDVDELIKRFTVGSKDNK